MRSLLLPWVLLLVFAPNARADIHVPTYLPSWTGPNIVVQNIVNQAHRPLFEKSASKATAVSTVTTGRADGPTKLAAGLPAAGRANAAALFGQLLDRYPLVEKQFGFPAGDVGGALALYLAANLEAYNHTSYDPKLMPALVGQVRSALAQDPRFAKMAMTERREMYEQLAILGTMMVVGKLELEQHPDAAAAARLKTAAEGYLRAALQRDPAKLKLTERGLTE